MLEQQYVGHNMKQFTKVTKPTKPRTGKSQRASRSNFQYSSDCQTYSRTRQLKERLSQHLEDLQANSLAISSGFKYTTTWRELHRWILGWNVDSVGNTAMTVLTKICHLSWYHQRLLSYSIGFVPGDRFAVTGIRRQKPGSTKETLITIYLAQRNKVYRFTLTHSDIQFFKGNGTIESFFNDVISTTIRFRGTKGDQLYQVFANNIDFLKTNFSVQSIPSAQVKDMATLIKPAAAAIGATPRRHGTHSPRSECASAMFRIGIDSNTIKQLDR
ncbi:LOW QUALITY PROTEIN: hypothetical protein PHMEG_00036248 [Phytophthora megakarya]|uniref:Uncharacterized protein n=1 Tax=Phytophthora megakarya TaxID=4795 RepID=A0A225UM74_9STRA|nr:LOW QUALITY PROTEIN: hypothetical protein PHMEG_00036248 [Phytophthora megakarya]